MSTRLKPKDAFNHTVCCDAYFSETAETGGELTTLVGVEHRRLTPGLAEIAHQECDCWCHGNEDEEP